jgi:hypothetical protein
VAQEQPAIDHFHCTPDGFGSRSEQALWTLNTACGLQDRLHVETLGWTVALADVYERVVFPEALMEETDDQATR